MKSFAESLAADLVDYETRERSRGAKSGRPQLAVHAMTAQAIRSLALLRAEALRVAALTAASTSIANDATRSASKVEAPHKQFYFTAAFPAPFNAEMAALSSSEDLFELHQLWLTMNAKLSFAHELSAARALASDRLSEQKFLHVELIADAWCRACSALRDVMMEIAQLMQSHGVSLTPPAETLALALLEAAASGLSPCIDDDGSFSLPGWAERRRERRLNLVLPIHLGIGIKAYPATSENFSTGGMQLVLGFMVPTGTRVVVQLGNGRRLDATVRWSDGGKAGLKFAAPLSDDDPLWSAANPSG